MSLTVSRQRRVASRAGRPLVRRARLARHAAAAAPHRDVLRVYRPGEVAPVAAAAVVPERADHGARGRHGDRHRHRAARAVVVVVAGGAVVVVVATGPVVVRKRRVEDHAPATPVGPLARTRHQRSTLAPGIDPVVSWDGVTVWLSRIGALNSLESSIWIV